FNADAIHLNNFNLVGEDLFLGKKEAGLRLNTFSFKEASGIDLEAFAFELSVNENDLSLSNLEFNVNETYLQGNIALSYSSINDLFNHFENTEIQLGFPAFDVETKEALRFAPDLKSNEV